MYAQAVARSAAQPALLVVVTLQPTILVVVTTIALAATLLADLTVLIPTREPKEPGTIPVRVAESPADRRVATHIN